MKRIILHWTAGGYYPNAHELECYHFLIDKDGNVHNGKYKPENNEICKPGQYAAHTGGGNTASIGVALCAMNGFKSRNLTGSYPITAKQFEASMNQKFAFLDNCLCWRRIRCEKECHRNRPSALTLLELQSLSLLSTINC